ncbi:MAG: SH3 domain-containing protein [Lachnospiraceae bacterium]|nr:SH3 domain-containing protein [Lachnospiraceae bacterium]
MTKKIIVSILCSIGIIGMVGMFFLFLYFTVPSQSAANSIVLPSTVADKKSSSGTSESSGTSGHSSIYVADVYQSLTLRKAADSGSVEITSLAPMTKMKILRFVENTDYAYVKVLNGEHKNLKGYVNSNYITQFGDNTVRVGNEE